MGRIRGKDIKGVAFDLHEVYPDKFSKDFEHNKKMVDDVKVSNSKKNRNRIAGYLVRVVRKSKRRV